MKNIFQHIEQPTLNIESIGCYDPYADLRDGIRKPKNFMWLVWIMILKTI